MIFLCICAKINIYLFKRGENLKLHFKEKMIEENKVLKIKPKDILDMWKGFWNPTPEEKTEEEEILGNNNITETEKKELLKALKSAEKLSSQLFKNSYKTTRLEIKDTKKSAEKALEKDESKTQKQISEKIENTEREI